MTGCPVIFCLWRQSPSLKMLKVQFLKKKHICPGGKTNRLLFHSHYDVKNVNKSVSKCVLKTSRTSDHHASKEVIMLTGT